MIEVSIVVLPENDSNVFSSGTNLLPKSLHPVFCDLEFDNVCDILHSAVNCCKRSAIGLQRAR